MTEILRRPAPRPYSPIKMAGPYIGSGDPKVVAKYWDEIGKDCYDNGYNAISLFLTYTANDFYPWQRMPSGRWNYSKLNPLWVQHIETMFDRLGFWRVCPHIKFVHQYLEKGDPFWQELYDNVEALYSSLTFAPTKFWWVQWDEKGHTPINFRTISPLGKGMELYINAVIAAANKARAKYKDYRISWAWANETFARFHEGEGHPYSTRGDRDEIHKWIYGKWVKAGFVEGKNLLSYMNYNAFLTTSEGTRPLWEVFPGNTYGRPGMRLEVHGIMDTQDMDMYIDHGQLNPRYVLFSTDGDKKMTADYKNIHKSTRHTDEKVDAEKLSDPIYPGNFMPFWRTYFPKTVRRATGKPPIDK